LPKHKTYFNWSSGKDSALALHYLLQDEDYSVERLITSVNAHHNRVSMHGLRRELLQQQIESLGISHSTIELPEQPSMSEYESAMKQTVERLKKDGFKYAAFGDIFLEDLKVYREQQLAPYSIHAVFPLWKKDTKRLLNEFIALGFKTIVVCVKSDKLDASFAGRIIDKDFIKDLPPAVDACGENGEFHTFCFDGPIFNYPISFTIGEKIFREYIAPKNTQDNCFSSAQEKSSGFWFCDLLPDDLSRTKKADIYEYRRTN
jgi:uncharacterized protein (TIGR00290 family)